MAEFKTQEEFLKYVYEMQMNIKRIKLYSNSDHRKFAEKILNEIVDNHPEFYNIAFFFGLYSVQIWSKKKREELLLGLEKLNDAIENNGSYFGIKTHGNMQYQKQMFEISKETCYKIVKIISEINLTKAQRNAINDIFGDVRASKYIVCNFFKIAIIKIFEEYKDIFDEDYEKLEDIITNIDDEVYTSFHNSNFLISLASKTKNIYAKNDVNYGEVYDVVKKAIVSLEEYPFEKDISVVLKGYLEHVPMKYLTCVTGKSTTYVKERYEKGKEILEILLFSFPKKI